MLNITWGKVEKKKDGELCPTSRFPSEAGSQKVYAATIYLNWLEKMFNANTENGTKYLQIFI